MGEVATLATQVEASPPSQATSDRMAQLEQELAEQRALIEAQQVALEELRTSHRGDAEADALVAPDEGGTSDVDAAHIAQQDPLHFYGHVGAGFERLFIPEELLIPTRESPGSIGHHIASVGRVQASARRCPSRRAGRRCRRRESVT